MVENTISSLKESETDFKFNIILVESSGLKLDAGQNHLIKYDQKRFSYNRALNLGALASQNDWLVFANNDLVFHRGWFSEIARQHENNSSIVSFTPWNRWNGWHDNYFPNNTKELRLGYNICRELGGWCIAVKRSIFDTIDLSERCSLWYSDNIYADALMQYGYIHALACHSFVDHLTSQTIDYNNYKINLDRDIYLEGKT